MERFLEDLNILRLNIRGYIFGILIPKLLFIKLNQDGMFAELYLYKKLTNNLLEEEKDQVIENHITEMYENYQDLTRNEFELGFFQYCYKIMNRKQKEEFIMYKCVDYPTLKTLLKA